MRHQKKNSLLKEAVFLSGIVFFVRDSFPVFEIQNEIAKDQHEIQNIQPKHIVIAEICNFIDHSADVTDQNQGQKQQAFTADIFCPVRF